MFMKGYFITMKNGGINMLKKFFAMSTTVVLAAGLLSGCGTKESSASKNEDTKKGMYRRL